LLRTRVLFLPIMLNWLITKIRGKAKQFNLDLVKDDLIPHIVEKNMAKEIYVALIA
jgi:hypothetical protein